MKKADIQAIFEAFYADNPKPKGELEHGNLYQLLVAVVLSAQATDKGVNKATGPLFKKIETPEQMVDLGEESLLEHIKSIGLYRNKGKNVINLSKQLIEKHGGTVPNNQKDLEALPGVGRKTANVVRNIGFGEPTIAVDTHLFRVGNRTGMAKGKTPLEVEKGLIKAVPSQFMLHAHHWLILHGRYICTARNPKCEKCIIYQWCKSKEKKDF